MQPQSLIQQVSLNETHIVPESSTDVPDDAPNDQPLRRMMIDRNSDNNTIKGETSQPAHASVVQTHAVVESATVDTRPPSASRRPKRTIRPRLQADQAEISDNDCTNSDCDDPKRPGELLKCSGVSCQSKVGTRCVGQVLGYRP